MKRVWIVGMLALAGFAVHDGSGQEKKGDNVPPPGFTALFNGKDLTNWQGLLMVPDPSDTKGKKPKRIPAFLVKLPADELAKKQKASDEDMRMHWKVVDGVITYDGKNNNLQTAKEYGNFELYVDWKIDASGDSGLYLRGNPQVQIWDINGKNNPKKIGSGGLYNNQKNPSNPLVAADNPIGSWNTFHVKMVGDKVTVKLNGKLVVDNTPLENFWHRGQALPARGPIELQHHNDPLWFKNIYVKELPD
jgi:Domain of Unknown Function (DUF1080)